METDLYVRYTSGTGNCWTRSAMCCEADRYLEEKEKIWNDKRRLAAQTGLPVVSCGLNIPYPLKKNRRYQKICEQMAAGLREYLAARGFKTVQRNEVRGAAGYLEFFTVTGEAEAVKRACVEFEETAPAGRIFDADVMRADGIQISRRDLNLEERRCYLCGRHSKYCCAAASHSQDEVIGAIERLLSGRGTSEEYS